MNIYIYIILWEEDDAKQLHLVLKVSCRQNHNLQPGTTIIHHNDHNFAFTKTIYIYNDSGISNNKKYIFPNVSYANILKQPSGMRRLSNLPAYIPPQRTSPISQVSESDL